MKKNNFREFFRKYIYGTAEKGLVVLEKVRIGRIDEETAEFLSCENRAVYITTRAFKHLYDKKPAEEFDFVLNHLHAIIRRPDTIYRDRNEKRGNFCLVTEIKGDHYIAVIEIVLHEDGGRELQIVTVFRMRDDKYLKNYDLLWSWRDGAHSSPRVQAVDRLNDAPQ